MQKLLSKVLCTALCLGFSTVGSAEKQTYALDPTHTFVVWQINHFGFSNPTGKWMANGTLVLDEKDPKNSSVQVQIPLAALVTAIPKLDEHLKSADFFDTSTYQIATFTSDKVEVIGKDTAKVYGTLDLHGVKKPLVLDVTLNKIGISPITHKKTAGFSATANLKRSDYNIKSYLPGLGDDVKLEIEAEGATGDVIQEKPAS